MGTGTPIRKQLRDAMKYQLGLIVAPIYRNTVRKVYDPPIDPEKTVSYPALNIEWGDETRTGDELAGNRTMYDLMLPCTVHCYLKANDIQTAQDNMIADVFELVGTNFYLTGSDGVRTAFIVTYEGADIWGYEGQSSSAPNGGVSIRLNCHYRVLHNDATILG